MDISKFWPGNGIISAVAFSFMVQEPSGIMQRSVPGHGLPGVAYNAAFRFLTDNRETLGVSGTDCCGQGCWQVFICFCLSTPPRAA